MHYTSPAHPQEKKQEYHIDYLQRLVHVYYNYKGFVIIKSCRLRVGRHHLSSYTRVSVTCGA